MSPTSPSSGPGQDLSRQFQQAAERVADLPPEQATPEMHTLYGLYKQATDGDHDTYQGEVGREDHNNPDGPAGLSQGQWEAWSQFKGMSKEDAMRRYVQEASHLPDAPTGSGKGDGPAPEAKPAADSPNYSQAQPTGQRPTNKPAAGEPAGTEADAIGAGLRGDLRAGAQYGSEEERKEDDDAQRGSAAPHRGA